MAPTKKNRKTTKGRGTTAPRSRNKNKKEDSGDTPRGYASPACSAHEVDPDYMWAPEEKKGKN